MMSLVDRLHTLWQSHRLLSVVSLAVLAMAAVELVGVVIFSFLLPLTG